MMNTAFQNPAREAGSCVAGALRSDWSSALARLVSERKNY